MGKRTEQNIRVSCRKFMTFSNHSGHKGGTKMRSIGKKSFVVIYVIALCLLSARISSAYMKPLPEPLPKNDDVVCVCETQYCDCKAGCESIYVMCMLFSLGTASPACTVAKLSCEIGCAADNDPIVKYTCYTAEPTPVDIYNQCVSDCMYKTGGDRLYCIVKCGGK